VDDGRSQEEQLGAETKDEISRTMCTYSARGRSVLRGTRLPYARRTRLYKGLIREEVGKGVHVEGGAERNPRGLQFEEEEC